MPNTTATTRVLTKALLSTSFSSSTTTPIADATVEIINVVTRELVSGITSTTTDKDGNYIFDYDPATVDLMI